MEICNEFLIKDYFLRLLYERCTILPNKIVATLNDLETIKTSNTAVYPWLKGKPMYWLFSQLNNQYYSILIDKAALEPSFHLEHYNRINVYRFKLKYPSFLKDLYIFEGYCTLPFHFHIYNIHVGQLRQNKLPSYMSILQPIDSFLSFVSDMPNGCNGALIQCGKEAQYQYAIVQSIESPLHTTTVNLLVTTHPELPDVFYLKCQHNGAYHKIDGFAYIDSMERSLYLQKIFANTDSFVMKCAYNFKFQRWQPLEPLDLERAPASLSPLADLEAIMHSAF